MKIASFWKLGIFVKCLKETVTELYISFETITRPYLYFYIL